MYHVAPVRMRESIEKYGIDPSRFEGERSTELGEPFVFTDTAEAEWYRDYMINQPPFDDRLETWEFDSEDPGEPDTGLTDDPDAETSSRLLHAPVPPGGARRL